MNGVHDMGGLECFGPVNPDPNEPLFHADWEKQVLALTLAMGATGEWNLDQGRFERESLPPSDYLSIGYYRIWLTALENLLVKNGLVTREELQLGRKQQPAKVVKAVLQAENVSTVLRKGSPVDRTVTTPSKFNVGDAVQVENQHKLTHTRLPAYIRGVTGVVHKCHGAHIFPDSHAHGMGEEPHWLYNIKFNSDDLWGTARKQSRWVHVDCWEPYLKTAEPSKRHGID